MKTTLSGIWNVTSLSQNRMPSSKTASEGKAIYFSQLNPDLVYSI